jgi:putative flippase GtrA
MADDAPVLRQLLIFSAIGTAGFGVDSAVLLAAMTLANTGPYVGRAISFIAAVTFTWALNRLLTFPGARSGGRTAQWARFAGVNSLGAAANLGLYAWLVASAPQLPGQPVTALAAGSVAGLALNFTLSRKLVFQAGA